MKRFAGVLLGVVLLAGAARADRIFYDGLEYPDVTVNGYSGESVLVTLKAGDRRFAIGKVKWIDLAAVPTFVTAEQARETDPKKAAGLYRESIRTINDPALKQLAEVRAIAPTDADGRYLEAMTDFLDVFAANPTEGTWKLRPTHLPAAGSTMLAEAADWIGARLGDFQSEKIKKDLKTLQLELYTKAGDPRADALVKELTTGIVESTGPKVTGPTIGGGSVEPVQAAIKAKDFAGAIENAREQLPRASEENAIRLYELVALAYQGENQNDAAAAELLRVASYYPASTSAATALLMAADIEKRQNHGEEAKRLYQEIREKYPTSPEAIKATGQ